MSAQKIIGEGAFAVYRDTFKAMAEHVAAGATDARSSYLHNALLGFQDIVEERAIQRRAVGARGSKAPRPRVRIA